MVKDGGILEDKLIAGATAAGHKAEEYASEKAKERK